MSDDRSGTFARLRAELVITSVLIVAASRLNLNLGKIPGVGVELGAGNTIPNGSLLLLLLCFYTYCLVAFVVRYRVENGRLASPSALFRSEIEELRRTVEAVRGWNVRDARLELDRLEVQFKKDVEKFRTASGELSERLAPYGENFVKPLPPEFYRRLSQTVASLFSRYGETVDPTSRAMMTEELLKSIETDPAQRLSASAQAVINLSGIASAIDSQVKGRTGIAPFLKEHEENLTRMIETQSTKVADALRRLNIEIGKLQASVDSLGTAVNFDRNALAFWVPLLASLSLVLYGLAFSWHQIVEAMLYIFPGPWA